MSTPMHIYDEIAERYGAKTEEEVDRFFQVEVFKLPAEVQQAIFDELLDSHAIPSKPRAPSTKPYARPHMCPPPPLRRESDWDEPD